MRDMAIISSANSALLPIGKVINVTTTGQGDTAGD
jgi:hypothetical protein